MGKTELLDGLRGLYGKIQHCEDLETKIKKQNTEIDEVKGKIKSELELVERTLPQAVPSQIEWDTRTHLGSYDRSHKPKPSKAATVVWIIAIILLIAISSIVTFLLLRRIDFSDPSKLTMNYPMAFVVAFAIVFFTLGYILRRIFKPSLKKIGLRANERADKRNEEKYLLQHKCERQAAYQKDIDERNEEIRTHRENAARLSCELDNCQKRLASLKSSLQESVSAVAADASLPAAYKKKEIVITIIEYLENLRADSLKEAINLYEYESRMNAHNSSMRQAAWERVNQSRLQAEAYERMAAEAARQSAAAENAARDARRAREANEEARDIIKEWDKKSN